jgi:hypothetical protein
LQAFDGRVVIELKEHTDKVRSLAVGEIDCCEMIATGGVDKHVVVWQSNASDEMK